jgi:hypothetical protein
MRVSFSFWKCLYRGVDHWTGPDRTGIKESSREVGQPQATAVGTKSGGPVPKGFMCNTLQHAALVPGRSLRDVIESGRDRNSKITPRWQEECR